MSQGNGWIKLHRKIENWEWFQDGNTFLLFIHLVLKANHTDQQWQGTMVKRGQAITGRTQLAKITGLSEQQVRTSLNKLKSTGEITSQTTNRFSVITINNYDTYQEDNQPTNKRVTSNQPTDNQQITTNKNEKNEKNEKNDKNNTVTSEFINSLKSKYPNVDITNEWEKLQDYCKATGKSYKDYQAALRNWVRRESEKKGGTHGTYQSKNQPIAGKYDKYSE